MPTEDSRISTQKKRTVCTRVVKLTPLVMFLVIVLNHKSANSTLDQEPVNTTVMVNQSTNFNCSTPVQHNDSQHLAWIHYPLHRGGVREYVYDDEEIRTKYKNRFDIDINSSSGKFNLLVLRPQLKDVGRYECMDKLLQRIRASVELTVLDSNLACESNMDPGGVVGPTQCDMDIKPDELQLSCSVSYNGKNAPQMIWRKVGDSLTSVQSDCKTNDNHVTCNTTLTADLQLNGSAYICQTTAQPYNCSLKVNDIIYAYANNTKVEYTTEDEVICFANTSSQLPCSYTWYKDNTTKVSSNQAFKPNDPGLYRCQAQCPIRNGTCTFTAKVIDVSNTSESGRNLHYLWFFLLIPVIGFGLFLIIWYIRQRNRNDPVPESHDLHSRKISQHLFTQDDHAIELEDVQHHRGPLPLENIHTDEVDSDYDIEGAVNGTPLIRKGLNGEIYGPSQYKGKQCAFEEITCSSDQEQIICSRGQKWKALNHDNLIKFYKIFERPSCIYIVREYAAAAAELTLREALDICKEDLSMAVVRDWTTQIARGMNYLHDNGIIHGSLFSAQIVIMESFQQTVFNKSLKILCFNLTGIRKDSSTREESSLWPPELYGRGQHTRGSDVWSFGIVVWEMLTREIPYKDEKPMRNIVIDIKGGAKGLKIPLSCPEVLEKLLNDCRIIEPPGRPSFDEIMDRLQAWHVDDS